MKVIISLIGSLIFAQALVAQSDVRTPNGQPQPKTIKEIREQDVQRRMANMRRLSQMPREHSAEKPKAMSGEELKRFKALVKPDKRQIALHKAFLKQKNTGVFRIFPDFDCETKNVVKADGKCKNFMPGTWLYSIRNKEHSNLDFHDLAFKRNRLVSNSLLSQGLMVELGDVSIEEVSLNQAELEFIRSFVASTDKKEARADFEKLSKSFKKDGFVYANNFAVKEDTTYVLRVIAYRFRDKFSTRLRPENLGTTKNGLRFASLGLDNRNDSIYAFRILKKADDGGLTILWKRLLKQKSPQLVFEKSEELEGFKVKNKKN